MRLARLTACVTATTLLLTACGGADDDSGGGGTGDPVIVGVAVGITGTTAFGGQEIQQALNVLVEDENAAGGINGRPIKLVFEDSQGDPATGANVVRKLITQHKAVALFGGYGTPENIAESTVAEQYQVPIVAMSAAGAEYTSRGLQYVASPYPVNKIGYGPLSEKAFPYIIERIKPKTAALLYPDMPPMSDGAVAMKKYLADAGVELVVDEAIDPKATSYSSAVAAVKRANPDFIATCWYAPQQATLFKEFRQFGINPKAFYLDAAAPLEAPFLEANGRVDGLIFTPIWLPESPYPEANAFAEKVKTKYNRKEVTSISVIAAVGAQVMFDALRAAGPENPEAVAKALRGTHDTLLGTLNFDEIGLSDLRPLTVQIQGDRNVFLQPEEKATGELVPWKGWQ